jgi:hypothetical protein
MLSRNLLWARARRRLSKIAHFGPAAATATRKESSSQGCLQWTPLLARIDEPEKKWKFGATRFEGRCR